jgi:hypothetical protein
MIASLDKMKNIQTNKKALVPISRPRARFSYDDLFCYLVRVEAVTEIWRSRHHLVDGSNPPHNPI